MTNQLFGEIQGYPEGSLFKNRMEIKNAGLHKYPVAGISRVLDVGCDCIVLNGGYIDDRDYGNEIFYTGEGGKEEGSPFQTYDQVMTKGNLDLSRNKYSGFPIRVIRGYKHAQKQFAPISGYRYDGLYYLEDSWPEVGQNGFRIWVYRLIKEINTVLPPTRDDSEPPRIDVSISQIKRDYSIPQKLKELYDYQCQVCNIRLEANKIPHAIGAHIKGLGKPHNGPDKKTNMLVLCPNDHHLFDQFGFSIEDDFTLLGIEGRLTVKHDIGAEFLQYHREKYSLACRDS